jgi:hypothetical protein
VKGLSIAVSIEPVVATSIEPPLKLDGDEGQGIGAWSRGEKSHAYQRPEDDWHSPNAMGTSAGVRLITGRRTAEVEVGQHGATSAVHWSKPACGGAHEHAAG